MTDQVEYASVAAQWMRPAFAAAVPGVGPSEPVEVNEVGGRQSAVPYRCDLLPPHATLAVAGVLKSGAEKYGPTNWHNIPVADHLNHLLVHVFAYLAGDRQDDHLAHAACRALMALELGLPTAELADGDLSESDPFLPTGSE